MKQTIFAAFCVGIILLGSCTTPNEPPSVHDRLALLEQINAPLSLQDRFVRVALTDRAGRPLDRLYRWPGPLRIQYLGPEQYRADVKEHADFLSAATGLPVHRGAENANMIVTIADPGDLRDYANRTTLQPYGRSYRTFICSTVQAEGSTLGQPMVNVDIADNLPPQNIQHCIVREMTQALGLYGDLGGRVDTSLNWGIVRELTDYDRQLIAILFDDRLRPGMPRDEVLAILPEIVADVEAGREAAGP